MSRSKKKPRRRGQWMAEDALRVMTVEIDDLRMGDHVAATVRFAGLGLPPGPIGQIAMEDGSARFVKPLLIPFRHEECTMVLDHRPPDDVWVEDGTNQAVAVLHGTDCEISRQIGARGAMMSINDQIPDYCTRRLAGGFFPWVTRDELDFA